MGAGPIEVVATCPNCGERVTFESHAYSGGGGTVEDASPRVLASLVGDWVECACGSLIGFEMERPRLVAQKPKPAGCPFCGNPKVGVLEPTPTARHHVRCPECGAEGPRADTKLSAVVTWNRVERPGETP